MNKRIEIKNKIEEKLRDNLSINNIFQSSILPQAVGKLPCIFIYINNETHTKSNNNDLYDNNCILNVVYFASGKDCTEDIETGIVNIDDNLDNMCIEIENIFCKSWETLDQLIYNMSLLSTTKETSGKEIEEIIGMSTMEFNVNYKVECVV